MNDIKISRKYSFWRHPIKYWRERKIYKFMNVVANHGWHKRGWKEKVEKAQEDLMFYGNAIINTKDL